MGWKIFGIHLCLFHKFEHNEGMQVLFLQAGRIFVFLFEFLSTVCPSLSGELNNVA